MGELLDEQFRLVRAALAKTMDRQFKRMGSRVGKLRAVQIAAIVLLDLAWAFHCVSQDALDGEEDPGERKEMFLKLAGDVSDRDPKDVTVH